jgi:hypothetical protein
VEVTGRGPLYGDLRKAEAEPELLARVRERYSDTEPLVWVQRLRVACRPSVDLAKRAAQGDLLAEVLAVGQEYAAESAKLDELGAEVLGKLWDNARAKKGLESLDPEALRELVFEAQLLCLDLLEEGS